jgi:hypothetical protein
MRCDECAHTLMVKPREFAETHGIEMLTPLLTISRRMRVPAAERGKAGVGRRRTMHEGLEGLGQAVVRRPGAG